MKISRLLEITNILIHRHSVTAAELAERFDVSTRTIYRDLDALSAAGIPVYTSRGAGGGISIMENYVLNRAALTEDERDHIVFALQALHATQYPELTPVLDKMSALLAHTPEQYIQVDFTSWGNDPNEGERFASLRQAILNDNIVDIDYIDAQNAMTRRRVEPQRLLFKHRAWYLVAWCYKRADWRTFRVSRIKGVRFTGETFSRNTPHALPETQAEPSRPKPMLHVVVRFSADALSRLYDEYDDDQLAYDEDTDTYTLEVDYPEDEWVYGYFMSFGPAAEILEPPHLRDVLRERFSRALAYYDE